MEGMPFWNNTQANLGFFFFFFFKWNSGFRCLIPIKLTVGGVSASLGCLISMSQSSGEVLFQSKWWTLEIKSSVVSSPASSSKLLRVSPTTSLLAFSIGQTLKSFSKECGLDTLAELRILPFLPPFLSYQAQEQLGQTFLLLTLLFFYSPAFSGLDRIREVVFAALGTGHICVP